MTYLVAVTAAGWKPTAAAQSPLQPHFRWKADYWGKPLQLKKRRIIIHAIILAAFLAACTPVEEVQRRWRAEQLKHSDVIPTSASGFIGAARLDTATKISFADPATGQARTATDESSIRQVLRLLSNGGVSAVATGSKPSKTFKLTLTLDPPERVVTLVYFPDKNSISLYNVPDVPWPQHYVGNYTVAPEFGAALTAILNAPGEQRQN